MGKSSAKKGKAARKARQSRIGDQHEELAKAPHSFVISRGHVGKTVQELMLDMRQVMEPYTASNLKVRKKNVLKDFVSIAGSLNVTHIMMFSKTEEATLMKLVRLPRGPTLTFKVKEYSLCKDVVSSIKKPNMDPKQFRHHPLLVVNNFTGNEMQTKLMSTMFQNMFPSININKVNLAEIKRTVMMNYNKESEEIDFRHYNIRAVPVGVSKSMKKLMKKNLPNLGRFEDVSEFVLKSGNLSDSEAEFDAPQSEVVLPQDIPGKGNVKSGKSAIRLTEIGPRLTLQLIKIEEGVNDGEILYHRYIKKTDAEIEAIRRIREKKKKLREQRKQQQERNVKRKETEKEEHKEKSLKGMRKGPAADKPKEVEEDDDAEYFREEVGENPDPELFSAPRSGLKRPHPRSKAEGNFKRKKRSDARESGPSKFGAKDRDSKFGKKKFRDGKDAAGKSKFGAKDGRPKFGKGKPAKSKSQDFKRSAKFGRKSAKMGRKR